LGLSLFDPDTNIWLYGVLLGAAIGWGIGFSSGYLVFTAPMVTSSIGLYIGWAFATLVFGEHIGAQGFLFALGGAIVGWRLGTKNNAQESNVQLWAFSGALLAGFLWIVIGEIILFRLLLNELSDHIHPSGTPWPILAGLFGSILGVLYFKKE